MAEQDSRRCRFDIDDRVERSPFLLKLTKGAVLDGKAVIVLKVFGGRAVIYGRVKINL